MRGINRGDGKTIGELKEAIAENSEMDRKKKDIGGGEFPVPRSRLFLILCSADQTLPRTCSV